MSEIRYDRLHDNHVIIAPERLSRPNCDMKEKTVVTQDKLCPFCEGNESMTPAEIFSFRESKGLANERGWRTRVVPNLYKAVQIEAPHQQHFGVFEHWEGFGAHEVIIDTPAHHISMTQWSEKNILNWLQTLRVRVSDLRGDFRLAYISLFKNEGKNAGSTQEHSHTQLIALPIIPKSERDLYFRSFKFYKENNHALMESIIINEEDDGARIVSNEGVFTAYCPYASAYPFEVIISSKKALGQIDTMSDKNFQALSQLLSATLKKLKNQLGCFDFNLIISTPPLQTGIFSEDEAHYLEEAHRLSIRIMPRIYQHGGFELSSDIMINPLSPELAAKLLRGSSNA